MGSQVVLTGSLNRKETAKKVAESDCLVCYSSFETFGVPIIEAWSCGIPAISTTACSVMDNFDSNLGIEISPYDYETLKKSMIGAIVNVVINYLLIPQFHAVGAVIGTIAAETSVCVAQALFVSKCLPIKTYIMQSIPFICIQEIFLKEIDKTN